VTAYTALFISDFFDAADQMFVERPKVLAALARAIADQVVPALLLVTFAASKDEIVEIIPSFVGFRPEMIVRQILRLQRLTAVKAVTAKLLSC
jgi:hypothetical protein